MKDSDESTEVLQSRLNELKAVRASLQADLLRAKEIPSTSQIVKAAALGKKEPSKMLRKLNEKVAEVEERCILYRTAGWTVFEMDLDVGRRGREARRQASPTQQGKVALGVGVRLDTFYEGRFYEPFYLIFAKSSQVELDEAKILAPSSLEDVRPLPHKRINSRVRLMRHTIPHFIPLSDILHSYLRSDFDEEDHDDNEETEGEGGLQLLDKLMSYEDLSLFLSQLHTYLQSFVSRRQQAIALGQLELPGLAHSSLRASGNDSFGQLTVRWDLPSPTSKDLLAFQYDEGVLYPNNDGQDGERPTKKQRGEGAVNSSLEISIVYHDLSSDRVGIQAKKVSERQQMIQALTNDETPGLKCNNATVLVEMIRSRVPAARRGDSDKHEKLQITRNRRPNWELLFSQTEQESQPDLQAAIRVVMNRAWTEELQRVSTSKE